MKLTKKAAALLLAASLAVSVCATPVFAAPETGSHEGSNEDGKTSADTVVTYRVDCSYTWSIPKKIDFGDNAGVNKTRIVEAINGDQNADNMPATKNGDAGKGNVPKVRVTKNIIDDDKTLHIGIDPSTSSYDTGTKKFYVVTNTSAAQKLEFEIKKCDAYGTTTADFSPETESVLTVASGTNTGEQELVFTLHTPDNAAEKAGIYNGKIVFKSELKSTT